MSGRAWGLLVLDKPAGLTSHTAVQRVRRALGADKAGHAGTLDPAATGVLLVALGKATRLLEFLVGHDKRYRARVRLGELRDTLDREGRLLETRTVPQLDRAGVEAVLAGLRGTRTQVPPAFSAIKQGGERLYRKARRGESPEPEPRPVRIERLELLDLVPPDLFLDVHCSSGTYVRALARDIGVELGCGGTLWELTRTASGPFSLEQALALDELERLGAAAWSRVFPARRMVAHLPAVHVDEAAAARLCEGGSVAVEESLDGVAAVFAPSEELLAVARAEGGCLRPVKVFA